MENKEDALDGSVQEIAVNHENPISTDPSPPAKGRHSSATNSAPFEGIAISVCDLPTNQLDQWEKVDEGEMPFNKRGSGQPPKISATAGAARKIVQIKLDELLPHPLNKKLYGPTSPDEIGKLAESIVETSQLSPLIVTADLEKIGFYTILGGHKRADALRLLGRAEANCQVVDVQDADERAVWLVEANRHHVPTTEQEIRIGEVYFEQETKKAKARKIAGAKSAKKDGKEVEVFTQPQTKPGKAEDDTAGKARDFAARKVGMSGVSFERGLKTLKAADKAELDGKKETAAELRRILNEKGVDPAYSHAKSLHLIEQTKKKKTAGGEVMAESLPKPGANAPRNLAPASNGHKTDDGVPPPVLLLADAGDAETVAQLARNNPQPPSRINAPLDALEADDAPPVVSIITACNKLADDLEELDPAELTNDQKWNLTRAFDNLMERIASHEQALEMPGQL